MDTLLKSLIGFRNYLSKNGKKADEVMMGANLADAGLQGALGYARLTALAQSGMKKGAISAAKSAATSGKAYSRLTAPLSLAVEAANAAWLASDAGKRARAQAEYADNSKNPAAGRMITGALNATDTLYATGKELYDAGKTYESVERSQMDEINNTLLRKIAAHESELARKPKKPTKSTLADLVTSSMKLKPKP